MMVLYARKYSHICGSTSLAAVKKLKVQQGQNKTRRDRTYPEPALAILGLDLLPIRHPVPVPPPQRRRVVHPNRIDVLNLKARALKFIHKEAQRRRRIRTG